MKAYNFYNLDNNESYMIHQLAVYINFIYTNKKIIVGIFLEGINILMKQSHDVYVIMLTTAVFMFLSLEFERLTSLSFFHFGEGNNLQFNLFQ